MPIPFRTIFVLVKTDSLFAAFRHKTRYICEITPPFLVSNMVKTCSIEKGMKSLTAAHSGKPSPQVTSR